jgi:hypothetical protein
MLVIKLYRWWRKDSRSNSGEQEKSQETQIQRKLQEVMEQAEAQKAKDKE